MARPDNVTPFRRPARPPPPKQNNAMGLATHRGRAVLVQALTLAAFVLSFLFPVPPLSLLGLGVGAAALFVAVSHRYEGMPWARTHHEHAVRTIVIGAVIWTLGSLLSYFGPLGAATIFVWAAVLIWVAVRAGVGLVLAILRKPIWRPTGLLF
ncbi:MAG TPA: hypothetical protein VG841_04525 [Caulobacterales bacterium]|nr:hypothetical protein [Caulobacterales bacterium]